MLDLDNDIILPFGSSRFSLFLSEKIVILVGTVCKEKKM